MYNNGRYNLMLISEKTKKSKPGLIDNVSLNSKMVYFILFTGFNKMNECRQIGGMF